MANARETDKKGIPIKGPYAEKISVYILYTVMTSIFTLVMGSISYKFIISPNSSDSQILTKLEFMHQYDLGYLYASFIILKIGQFLMGMNAGNARKYCRVHPPDQHIYKVHGEDKMGYVFMDQEGVNGKFNRAQRAIANYQETFPQTALYIIASGLVYPKQVMALVTLYSASRFLSALGYTKSTDGRMSGFMISQLTGNVFECLTGIIAYQAITFEE